MPAKVGRIARRIGAFIPSPALRRLRGRKPPLQRRTVLAGGA